MNGSGWMGQDGWVRMAGMGMGQGGWVRMDCGQDGWVEMGQDGWVRPQQCPSLFALHRAAHILKRLPVAHVSQVPSSRLQSSPMICMAENSPIGLRVRSEGLKGQARSGCRSTLLNIAWQRSLDMSIQTLERMKRARRSEIIATE